MFGISIRTIRLIRSVAALGGWVVLSLFFMGQTAGYIPSTSTKILEKVSSLEHQMTVLQLRQEEMIERLTIALKVFCENTAKGPSELNNCRNIR